MKKFLDFSLLLWVTFALLDPDPDSEYGSGSTDPIESGSNSDPDPDTHYAALVKMLTYLTVFFICKYVYCLQIYIFSFTIL